MTTELFTLATRTAPGLARLQASLTKFSVPVTILGQNELGFRGFAWKWKSFIRAAKASSADTVIYCDGYDTICLDSLSSMATKFAGLAHPIIFSYEPRDQPEYWLGLCAGLVMANREAIVTVFDRIDLEEMMQDNFIDQEILQTMYARDSNVFTVDRQGVLFHTLGRLSPELAVSNNRLINPATGQAPSFVHAPYGWDLSKVEQWVNAQN